MTDFSRITSAANPSGWYHDNNGIKAGLEALEALQPKKDEKKVSLFSKAHALTKQIIKTGDNYAATFAACLKMVYQELVPTIRLNRANLHNLVSTGSIFSLSLLSGLPVSFAKYRPKRETKKKNGVIGKYRLLMIMQKPVRLVVATQPI